MRVERFFSSVFETLYYTNLDPDAVGSPRPTAQRSPDSLPPLLGFFYWEIPNTKLYEKRQILDV
jgi:hypothetical protein